MKFYVNPQINVELLSLEDVLTLSNVIPTLARTVFDGSEGQEKSDSFDNYF